MRSETIMTATALGGPMASVRLRYRKAGFLPTLILLSFALFFLNAFFALTVFDDWGVILLAALVSFLALMTLGVSPLLTDHILGDYQLELRQGWYFRARVPLSNVRTMQLVDRGPMRTGVFFELRGDALYVTTQRKDLMLLTLKERQRFGFALGKNASRIYFDTIDRDVAIKRLVDKALTPSNPGLRS